MTVGRFFGRLGGFSFVGGGIVQNTAVCSELYLPVCKNRPLTHIYRPTVNWTAQTAPDLAVPRQVRPGQPTARGSRSRASGGTAPTTTRWRAGLDAASALCAPLSSRLRRHCLCHVVLPVAMTLPLPCGTSTAFVARRCLCLVCSTAFAAKTPPLPRVLRRPRGY